MKTEGNTEVSIASRITAGVFSYETRPTLALLIGPFIGLIYVLTLPVIFIATVLYYVSRRLGMNYPRQAKSAISGELPQGTADLTENR